MEEATREAILVPQEVTQDATQEVAREVTTQVTAGRLQALNTDHQADKPHQAMAMGEAQATERQHQRPATATTMGVPQATVQRQRPATKPTEAQLDTQVPQLDIQAAQAQTIGQRQHLAMQTMECTEVPRLDIRAGQAQAQTIAHRQRQRRDTEPTEPTEAHQQDTRAAGASTSMKTAPPVAVATSAQQALLPENTVSQDTSAKETKIAVAAAILARGQVQVMAAIPDERAPMDLAGTTEPGK